jgi:flavin-dependent dehydrogenase
VLLVDRAAFPRDKACSEYLSPATVQLLEDYGIVGDLERAGAHPLAGTTVIGAGGSRLTGRFDGSGGRPPRPMGLSVSRRVLDALLLGTGRAAGVEVLERTTAEDLVYDRGAVGGAVLRDASGRRRTAHARITIGCDGLRSMVARRIGRRRHGKPSRMAFVAHLRDLPGLEGTAEMHVGPEGYVGLNRIESGLANVALVVPQSFAGQARGRALDFFFERLGQYPGVRHRVSLDQVVRRLLVTGPFAAWSGRVITDGALLAGDAADFFDPFTGEGIHAALKGAELAAPVISRALAQPGIVRRECLAEYVGLRRRAFAGKWTVERLIGYGMLLPRIFDRAVARIGRRPGMADTLIGVTGDFRSAYEVLNPLFLARMVF